MNHVVGCGVDGTDAREALSPGDVSRVIEMAWQDHVPFEALQLQFGLGEPAVIALMRTHLKKGSFRLWRQRVTGRRSKHQSLTIRHSELSDSS